MPQSLADILGPFPADLRRRCACVEIHAAHACNLTCESCAHFSNSGHRGTLGPGEADAMMGKWCQRLRPDSVALVGGEPTLNPQLCELIYVCRRRWPDARLSLTTNGFFLERHPDLPRVLWETNTEVVWTVHHHAADYLEHAARIKSIWDRWLGEYRFLIKLEDAALRWTRRHRGIGAEVLPFEDGDPGRSWSSCVCANRMQLFRGRLWKCPPLAYLQLQKERYPELSPQWDRYLAYEGLAPDCSDAQLDEFLGRKAEATCAMCPAQPRRFDKPSPLVPLATLLRQRRNAAAAIAGSAGGTA